MSNKTTKPARGTPRQERPKIDVLIWRTAGRKPPRVALAAALAAGLALGGCAAVPPGLALLAGAGSNSATAYTQTQAQNIEQVAFGRIVSMQEVTISGSGTAQSMGTVLGAITGGFLGSRIGQGHGSTVAGIAGAIGGGVLGNHLAGSTSATKGYQITLRLDNGAAVAVTQAADVPLAVGERVELLTGNGPARIVPAKGDAK